MSAETPPSGLAGNHSDDACGVPTDPPDASEGSACCADVCRVLAAAVSVPESPRPGPQDGTPSAAEPEPPARAKWAALAHALSAEGGQRVHRMLSGAAAEALCLAGLGWPAGASGGSGGTSGAPGAGTGRARGQHLSDCAWDVAWEKLHVGDWKVRGKCMGLALGVLYSAKSARPIGFLPSLCRRIAFSVRSGHPVRLAGHLQRLGPRPRVPSGA